MPPDSTESPEPGPLIFNPPPLPLELTDLIIDYLAATKMKRLRANLAACALVCRAWTPRSRSHFFRNCRLLLAKHNTIEFGILIRSPICTIRPFVHQLTMRNHGEFFFDDISDALKLLAKVESLRLAGSSWEAHGAAPRLGFMQSLPNVVDLEVDCPDLGDFDHALGIFCAFPALERLTVNDLKSPKRRLWRAHPPMPYFTPSRVTPPLHLTSLNIDCPANIHIFHWLNMRGDTHLTSLHLRLPSFEVEDLGPLHQFLHSQSASLERFSLFASFPLLEQADIERTFDFREFSRLKIVRIGPLFGAILASPMQEALPAIIRTLTSPFLNRLTLELDAARLYVLAIPQVDWAPADNFLADKLEALCASKPHSQLATTPHPDVEATNTPVPFSVLLLVPARSPPVYKHTIIPTPEAHAQGVAALAAAFPRLLARGALDIRADALKTTYKTQSGAHLRTQTFLGQTFDAGE
ncbi:hypothetical protein B0H11DRAFT_2023665 [Mycena galericulata]|nr:hypothetical protein B0H11DRAFT_2023665 [Mycena galericulata]